LDPKAEIRQRELRVLRIQCRQRDAARAGDVLAVSMEDHSNPCVVAAFEGSVVIKGPGSMHGAFTADAAEQTGLLMIEAASKARLWIDPALAL
jgi:hypothetical protein